MASCLRGDEVVQVHIHKTGHHPEVRLPRKSSNEGGSAEKGIGRGEREREREGESMARELIELRRDKDMVADVSCDDKLIFMFRDKLKRLHNDCGSCTLL